VDGRGCLWLSKCNVGLVGKWLLGYEVECMRGGRRRSLGWDTMRDTREGASTALWAQGVTGR